MTDHSHFPRLRFDFHPDGLDSTPFSGPLCFGKPERILEARQICEVLPALQAVQEAVKGGYYAAGFVAYEAAPAFDPAMTVQTPDPSSDFPLLWFGLFTQPRAEQELFPTENNAQETPSFRDWHPSITVEEYNQSIAAIRDAIAGGETYQVNYTIRLRAQGSGEEYALYQRLLRAQEARYGAYLDLGRYRILSASPELFFHRQGERIITRPMKGTARRGRWQEEDQEQAQALQRSEKNRAENIMIVDLLRNDLGRIAAPGSVQVSNLFALERYPTVWQMTSTVEAKISAEATISDIFSALFPCGSVTGAPKIQTMRHIAQLEDSPRQSYCGAIGLITPQGTATFNVAIRTLLVNTQTQIAEYGVGGGITWDSTAQEEYSELLAKAAVLETETPEFELLETLRLENGIFPRLAAHLRRIRDTAAYFGFPDPAKKAKRALYQAARQHENGMWRVRLRFSRQAKAVTEAFPLEPNPELPLTVVLAESPIDSSNRFLYHKTTHREVYAAHRRRMAVRGSEFYDVLLWNERGELTEFTTGNLVVEREGNFWTPPRECGLLAGIRRAEALSQREIHERILTREDLPCANGIWLINSVRGWLPVNYVASGE